ncbi:MAG: substrate-binding domain-containing protein [Oscillospiraceae bacterium]|jgi:phosphate transport system substrate-binding protein|nr:substrate-binding domain-containing protein [Oscillospiraceae bacterium]
MKKFLSIMATAVVLLTATSCAKGGGDSIYVIRREESAGTHSAFIELCGIESKDENGNNTDNTLDAAEVTKDTSVMLISVAGDPNAIGYVSLGSFNDSVKALEIDGVAPSVAAIREGSYTLARPFNIVTNGTLAPEAQAFVEFIRSEEGQAVVEAQGYVPLETPQPAAEAGNLSGTVKVNGSSSVTPLMERLAEAFAAKHGQVQIDVSQSDSTMGVADVRNGRCDIGMASRALKESEAGPGVLETQIATDGIAVIVCKENPRTQLTKEQVRKIYTGETTAWAELG